MISLGFASTEMLMTALTTLTRNTHARIGKNKILSVVRTTA